MLFCFLFAIRFQLGASSPRGTVGCATSPFRVGFRLSFSRPRHDGGLLEGFDVGCPCHKACVLLQFVFRRLARPATLAVRGSFLTMVCLIIAPFSSRPPAALAVRGKFLTVLCLIIVTAFPSITFLRVFPGFIAKPFRGAGVGFEEPRLRLMF